VPQPRGFNGCGLLIRIIIIPINRAVPRPGPGSPAMHNNIRPLTTTIQLILGLALASTSPIAVAQATQPATLPKISVHTDAEDTGYQASRSTAGTRTDTPLQDVPQSITVINSETIADQAMTGMADVVRYVPGITMGQGEGNRDQPKIACHCAVNSI
jgi:outer membrane receptor for monomeric catechols